MMRYSLCCNAGISRDNAWRDWSESSQTSLQQLFVMNSAFMQRLGDALADEVRKDETYTLKIRDLYRKVLSRDPSVEELAEGRKYLTEGTVERFAQILLSTNEEIFSR